MPIFDRFIQYEWAEHALDLAWQQTQPHEMKAWLIKQGIQGDSARRTANILTWLWFCQESPCNLLGAQALAMLSDLSLKDRRALHWGMAICVFPSFRETVQVIGRLTRLQGHFLRDEIVQRVLENYSNQSTMRRAIERTIQTLLNWEILDKNQKIYTINVSQVIHNPALIEWLYRCLLITTPERYWLISDLTRAPELFPFELPESERLFYASAHFSIHRDANGAEIVGLA